MKRMINELNTELSDVSLSVEEKTLMRSHITAFMQEHPLLILSDEWYGKKTPFKFRFGHLQTVIGIVAMVLIGTSVATAAESSLPGDVLYPIKVNVNEEVRSAMTVSPEAQAVWDAQRAARRLQEAEQLAVQGRLDASTTAQLEAKFEEHTADSIAHAQESKDPATKAAVHSEIEATLEAHKTVIDNLIKTNDELQKPLEGVADVVSKNAEVMADARVIAEHAVSDATTTPKEVVKQSRDAIRDKINNIEKKSDELRDSLDSSIMDLIDSRFSTAVRIYDKGKKLYAANKMNESLVVFQDAERAATQAEVLLSISETLASDKSDAKQRKADNDAAATSTLVATTTDGAATDDTADTSDASSTGVIEVTIQATTSASTTPLQKLKIDFGL